MYEENTKEARWQVCVSSVSSSICFPIGLKFFRLKTYNCLWANLTKDIQNFCEENSKTSLRSIRGNLNKWRYAPVHELEDSLL